MILNSTSFHHIYEKEGTIEYVSTDRVAKGGGWWGFIVYTLHYIEQKDCTAGLDAGGI